MNYTAERCPFILDEYCGFPKSAQTNLHINSRLNLDISLSEIEPFRDIDETLYKDIVMRAYNHTLGSRIRGYMDYHSLTNLTLNRDKIRICTRRIIYRKLTVYDLEKAVYVRQIPQIQSVYIRYLSSLCNFCHMRKGRFKLSCLWFVINI